MGTVRTEFYRCPTCRSRLTESTGKLVCDDCDGRYAVTDDYVDFLSCNEPSRTPITSTLFELIPPVYDTLYFPALYRLGAIPENYTPNDQALELLERTDTQRSTVLDLACGTGRLTRKLAEINRRVFALDRSRSMLQQAVGSTPRVLSDRVEYCRGDAFELPFEASTFHALTCSGAFYFFPELHKALTEINRVLKTGSRLVGMTVVDEGLLGISIVNWLMEVYGTIGTYEIHDINSFEKILEETGFKGFHYERHGSILIFDATKANHVASENR